MTDLTHYIAQIANCNTINRSAIDVLVAGIRERDEEILRLRTELSWIDEILARRPALDKPSRWENVEYAISTAKEADNRGEEIKRLRGQLEDAKNVWRNNQPNLVAHP